MISSESSSTSYLLGTGVSGDIGRDMMMICLWLEDYLMIPCNSRWLSLHYTGVDSEVKLNLKKMILGSPVSGLPQ